MPIKTGQTYAPSSAAEVRDDFLTDVRLEAIAQGVTDPPVEPNTEWYMLGTGLGNIAMLLYANLRISEDNADARNATGDELDVIREAEGLPEVLASPAAGKVLASVAGDAGLFPTVTIPDGLQGKLPNGFRCKVQGQHIGVQDGDEVAVVTIDKGSEANLDAGEKIQWLSPPGNLETNATVSANAPLRGGSDDENDERKRARIFNRRQNLPAAGNWARLVEESLNAHPGIQYAFVYPALGGPASRKVVLVKDVDPDSGDYSRAPSVAAVTIVRDHLFATLPSETETVVQAVADESVDVSVKVTIPDAVSSGGNGEGWYDDAPWPPLDGGDTKVSISAIGALTYTLNASTTTTPIEGQTHVAWWSSVDQRFYVRLVVGFSGGTGAWVLEFDQPLTDSNGSGPVVGEYVSPAAINIEAYGDTWREVYRNIGPGENTTDAWRLPRALRHPLVINKWRSGLTVVQLKDLLAAHDEISDVDWSYRSLSSPTVPASVATAPNILTMRHFGIYEL